MWKGNWFTKHRRGWRDVTRSGFRNSQALFTPSLESGVHSHWIKLTGPTDSVKARTAAKMLSWIYLLSPQAFFVVPSLQSNTRQQILPPLHITLLWGKMILLSVSPLYGYVHTAAPSGPHLIRLSEGSVNSTNQMNSDVFKIGPRSYVVLNQIQIWFFWDETSVRTICDQSRLTIVRLES